jgi:sarcosine oxidase subunit beta
MRQPQLTSALPASADVVIVGGGVVGAATAFYAARAGWRPVIVERRPALATLTTAAAAGGFRLQFDNRDELELVRTGVDLFLRFAEEAGLPGWDLRLCQQGYLWCATRSETAARQRAIVARQRAWGLADVELIDGDEARRRFPYLAPEVIQARFRSGDGWLDPIRLAAGYWCASGAPLVTGTQVTGFRVAGGRMAAVRTTRGEIATDRAVIAAGPFSAELAARAGVEIELRLVRRQRVVMPDVPEVPAQAPMTIDEETGAHWRPAPGGAYLLWTQHDAPAGPALEEVPVGDDYAFALLDPASPFAVARISPFWHDVWTRSSSGWLLRAGQYEYTPDHRPYLGATHVEGLFVNCGYSGHGVMSSAGGSRIVVEAMLGRGERDHAFRVDRAIAARELDVL